jgi:hypothetical protein
VLNYATVQMRLAFHSMGVPVDAAPLVRALDGMRLQLTPLPASA